MDSEMPRSDGSRDAKAWRSEPPLPKTHFVDPKIFGCPDIYAEEVEKIWNKTWLPIMHEDEVPEPLRYRTASLAGNKPIIVVRAPDNKVRAFLNVCPHRGNMIMRSPAGTLADAQPSGNPNHMTCMYHGWQFDAYGKCVEVPREKDGYQERICSSGLGLREIKTEVAYGGLVWVNLDDDCGPLSEFVGDTLNGLTPHLEQEPLEIFHYQKSIIRSNWKLLFEASREFYHDYLHYHNKQTSMIKPGYFDQKYTQFPNGHSVSGFTTVDYSEHGGTDVERAFGFPLLEENGWRHVTLFPTTALNLRTSCLRMNVMTPISERETLFEIRGFGLKSDTPEQREQRVRDYNAVWGPFGWNVHEDLMVAETQFAAIADNDEAPYTLVAREEGEKVHDEVGLRTYYGEWSKLMGRMASDPDTRMA